MSFEKISEISSNIMIPALNFGQNPPAPLFCGFSRLSLKYVLGLLTKYYLHSLFFSLCAIIFPTCFLSWWKCQTSESLFSSSSVIDLSNIYTVITHYTIWRMGSRGSGFVLDNTSPQYAFYSQQPLVLLCVMCIKVI